MESIINQFYGQWSNLICFENGTLIAYADILENIISKYTPNTNIILVSILCQPGSKKMDFVNGIMQKSWKTSGKPNISHPVELQQQNSRKLGIRVWHDPIMSTTSSSVTGGVHVESNTVFLLLDVSLIPTVESNELVTSLNVVCVCMSHIILFIDKEADPNRKNSNTLLDQRLMRYLLQEFASTSHSNGLSEYLGKYDSKFVYIQNQQGGPYSENRHSTFPSFPGLVQHFLPSVFLEHFRYLSLGNMHKLFRRCINPVAYNSGIANQEIIKMVISSMNCILQNSTSSSPSSPGQSKEDVNANMSDALVSTDVHPERRLQAEANAQIQSEKDLQLIARKVFREFRDLFQLNLQLFVDSNTRETFLQIILNYSMERYQMNLSPNLWTSLSEEVIQRVQNFLNYLDPVCVALDKVTRKLQHVLNTLICVPEDRVDVIISKLEKYARMDFHPDNDHSLIEWMKLCMNCVKQNIICQNKLIRNAEIQLSVLAGEFALHFYIAEFTKWLNIVNDNNVTHEDIEAVHIELHDVCIAAFDVACQFKEAEEMEFMREATLANVETAYASFKDVIGARIQENQIKAEPGTTPRSQNDTSKRVEPTKFYSSQQNLEEPSIPRTAPTSNKSCEKQTCAAPDSPSQVRELNKSGTQSNSNDLEGNICKNSIIKNQSISQEQDANTLQELARLRDEGGAHFVNNDENENVVDFPTHQTSKSEFDRTFASYEKKNEELNAAVRMKHTESLKPEYADQLNESELNVSFRNSASKGRMNANADVILPARGAFMIIQLSNKYVNFAAVTNPKPPLNKDSALQFGGRNVQSTTAGFVESKLYSEHSRKSLRLPGSAKLDHLAFGQLKNQAAVKDLSFQLKVGLSLHKCKLDVERSLREAVTSCVITLPTTSTIKYRQDVYDAAIGAGFVEVDILLESSAIILDKDSGSTRNTKSKEEHTLVVFLKGALNELSLFLLGPYSAPSLKVLSGSLLSVGCNHSSKLEYDTLCLKDVLHFGELATIGQIKHVLLVHDQSAKRRTFALPELKCTIEQVENTEAAILNGARFYVSSRQSELDKPSIIQECTSTRILLNSTGSGSKRILIFPRNTSHNSRKSITLNSKSIITLYESKREGESEDILCQFSILNMPRTPIEVCWEFWFDSAGIIRFSGSYTCESSNVSVGEIRYHYCPSISNENERKQLMNDIQALLKLDEEKIPEYNVTGNVSSMTYI